MYDSLCRLLGNKDKVLGICVGIYVVIAAYLACHIFAGRAAYLIMGAMLATIMSANVSSSANGWPVLGSRRVSTKE